MIKLSFLCNDQELPSEALPATDGKWVAAGYHYVHDARAKYEQRIRVGETASDDLFAWVDQEDAGAFAAI